MDGQTDGWTDRFAISISHISVQTCDKNRAYDSSYYVNIVAHQQERLIIRIITIIIIKLCHVT